MKISVIISTYDRCQSLDQTLKTISQQNWDGSFEYEVIVVDNNSKDKTKEVIESFIKENPKMKYVFEANQGISSARNAGINNAQGEIIAFTDDDVIVDKNWISNINNFSLNNTFDAIGGKVLPTYPLKAPDWVKSCKDILCGPIVNHDHGDSIKEYDNIMLPFIGANMVIKKIFLNEIGLFNTSLGAGTGTMGEDFEYFRRLQKGNKKIIYHPNIIVYHPVEPERMTLKYLAQWYIKSGRYLSVKEINNKRTLVMYFQIPRYLIKQVLKSGFQLGTSIFNTRAFMKSWSTLFISIGMIQGYRKFSHTKKFQHA